MMPSHIALISTRRGESDPRRVRFAGRYTVFDRSDATSCSAAVSRVPSSPLPIVERRMTNTDKIKIAAAIAVLVGTGVVLYVKLGRDTSAPKKRKPPEPE